MKKKIVILLTAISVIVLSVVSVFHAAADTKLTADNEAFTEVLPTMNADGAVVGQIYRIPNYTVEAYAPVYVRFYFYIGEQYEKLFSTILELDYDAEYLQIDNHYCVCTSVDYTAGLVQNGSGRYNLTLNSQNQKAAERTAGEAICYVELRFYFTEKLVDFYHSNVFDLPGNFEAVESVMPGGKIEVGLHLYKHECYNVVTDKNSLDVIELDENALEIVPAYVQLAYSTVHYELGEGVNDEMMLYDDADYPIGMQFVPENGEGLAYIENGVRPYRKVIPSKTMSERLDDVEDETTAEEKEDETTAEEKSVQKKSPVSPEIDGTSMVFSHWVADTGEEYYPNDGKMLRMPAEGITLYAAYYEDLDNDSIPDNQEYQLRYRLRDGDMDYLDLKNCPEGSFYYETDAAGNEYACINIIKGHKIGTAIPNIIYPDEYRFGIWKFDHFAIGKEIYSSEMELSKVIPYQDTVIQVCTMADDNGNGHDDRLSCIVYFYPYGTVDFDKTAPLKVYTVSDNALYIIYQDIESIFGYVDSDEVRVVLPYMEDIETYMRFLGWEFRTYDIYNDGCIDEIEVEPIYSDLQEIKLFNTIIPNPDPEAADPKTEDIYMNVPVGLSVIHRDRKGVIIDNIIVEKHIDYITNNVQLIDNPGLNNVLYDLPSRDEENDPFVGWIVGGIFQQVVNGHVKDFMYLDPYYAKKKPMTVIDPKSRLTAKDDIVLDGYDCLLVPIDSTYEIFDGERNSLITSPIPNNGIITLQYDEKVLPRNSAGNIFRHEWGVERETTETGSWNYRIYPLYTEPESTEYDIELIRSGKQREMILAGQYMDDDEAALSFYARIMDTYVEPVDLQFLKLNANAVFGFDKIKSSERLISDDYWLTYEGTTRYRGLEWGVVTLHYRTKNSGIIWCSLHCSNESVENGYYVVTVGDCSIDGRVNSIDTTQVIQIVNGIVPIPYRGYNAADENNSYRFELADVNKDGKINSVDVTELVYMNNGIVISN